MHILHASALALLVSSLAAQTTIVSPLATATVEGNSNNAFPWNSATVRRYTQIHSDIGGAARNITQLRFRQNAGNTTNYLGVYACDLEMFMGDSVDWDQATFVFANNYVGSRNPVFARRVINLGPLGQNATTGPLPFTVTIPLDAPYAYSGARSLVWEAVVHANTLSGGSFNQVDAESGSGASGTSTITGTGCTATGRTTAMTHTFGITDRGGVLVAIPTVSNGPASSATVLTLGATNPNIAFPGLCGNVYTDLLAFVDLGVTSAAGAITGDSGIAFVVPNTFNGVGTLTSQAVSVDLGRIDPIPLSVSNGRSTTLPLPALTNVIRVSRIYNNTGGTSATVAAAITSAQNYAVVTEFTY